MKKINFAIIGYGGIAKTHALGVYDANLRFSLPYSLNLKYIVTRKPIDFPINGVKNVTDIEEVLNDEEIDFIDICTPNDSHFDIVKKAVEHGKAIYCEKPLATNMNDAMEMAKLVKENNIMNSVALVYRFMPALTLLKRELEVETIGKIIDFKVRTYHDSYLNEKKKDTWRTGKNSGGGALLDLGVHLIDMIQFTMGDIKEVESKTRIYFEDRSEVDEIANCDFLLVGGVRGSLEVSRVFTEREQTDDYVVYGSHGSIKINFNNPYEIEVYKYESNSTEIKNVAAGDSLLKYYADKRNSLGYFQNCHTASIISFADKISNNKNSINNSDGVAADFEQALKCQRIIDKVYNK
ncbi:Gfo/Idh/MocA family protein [Clostridium lacusfryxellense]|uniref:Gfo/Idh/MocA family protein n=1 Tax=Clostridium lacusfryxellense TaxID=205328 RepID=UPI001C0DD74C|nr:Gfo/Idh/MocA family oxidoreductase [Clostridium lacusfryxellense]MBU3111510.1 Gfo/Idh/MocA family oxidoreductase [Clostridium lacusfryxellense]